MPAPTLPTFEAPEKHPVNVGFYRPEQSAQLAEAQKKLNGSRKPGLVPRVVKDLSKQLQCYIFNVGPKPQEGSGASYGRVMIQGCPEDKEYSEPFLVPGIPYEQYPHNVGRLTVEFHGDEDDDTGVNGWDWACQAIGGFTNSKGRFEGKFLKQSNSLEKFGVGISKTWPPAKEDVALARKKMLAEYALLVGAAREAHQLGQLSKLLAVNGEFYFIAARALGLSSKTERWMEFSAPTEAPAERNTKNCSECAEEILFEAKKCRYCGSAQK